MALVRIDREGGENGGIGRLGAATIEDDLGGLGSNQGGDLFS